MKKTKIDYELLIMQYKIHANSPYNDGWTKEYYKKLLDKTLKKIKKHKN